ncbi:MAG TPA: hypothetical protein VM864_02080 [Pyrinomonadaceae bacterium]|jgi:uncharacterized membrane protein|nr:hypothetical protein [Pyrinomonadaceae bacterium]
MRSLYLPLALVIGGNILYHVSQRSVPKTANPLATMMAAYAVGILICAAGGLFYPSEKSFISSLRESNWTAVVIGVGVAAVEIGFLLTYRAGWRIGVAPVVASVAVALLLIPVGVALFGEHLSYRNLIGVALCIAGLILLARE